VKADLEREPEWSIPSLRASSHRESASRCSAGGRPDDPDSGQEVQSARNVRDRLLRLRLVPAAGSTSAATYADELQLLVTELIPLAVQGPLLQMPVEARRRAIDQAGIWT
jgi:hypothetical protein